ncbi:MAG: S8 family serine peptidase, partial [Acidimicrobiia bacterium]
MTPIMRVGTGKGFGMWGRRSAAAHSSHQRRRIFTTAMVLTMVAGYVFGAGAHRADAQPGTAPAVGIIVREVPGAGDGPEQAVEAAGGSIGLRLGIIDGFAATVPPGAVETITAHPEVLSVTPDGSLTLTGRHHSDDGENDDEELAAGSMTVVNDKVLKSTYFWKRGFTGEGVGVAIIDSGTAPVEGLTSPGKVTNGADLSFDSQQDNLRYLDLYGHGTHIAGIIAGHDGQTTDRRHSKHLEEGFTGVAPQANILSVKVADGNGIADVSQVIAAIDWVVQHRNDQGMNIRVLNLAFGTDGMQDYRLDPLAYAAEVAWRRGIVVVVAAGNDGNDMRLRNPSYDPFVIAVGANDANGTGRTADDEIPAFSNCGSGERSVDVVAPGRSVISLRVPGSHADTFYPHAAVGDRFFKGTGTSQAAAMVSGAVALVLDQRPHLTPDQVKDLLISTAQPIPDAPAACAGVGQIDLKAAFRAKTPDTVQDWDPS